MTHGGATVLVVEVTFFDGRFHGEPEWPPSPARLFQALVAAAANGNGIEPPEFDALAWLERCPPPTIIAPLACRGVETLLYVPNNDLDAKGGDPALVHDLRVPKRQTPRLFDVGASLVYAWDLPPTEDALRHLPALQRCTWRLYQLGRGIDPAWATIDTWTPERLANRARADGVEVWRPGGYRGRGPTLDCPASGSLESLAKRHRIQTHRLEGTGSGKRRKLLLQQAPRPRFSQMEYGSGSHPLFLVLRPTDVDGTRRTMFEPWPLTRIHDLVVAVRDAAHDRLVAALPDVADAARRQLVGRQPGERNGLPLDQRVRIVPLPSIGSDFADRAIRRLAVMLPDHGPIAHEDLAWTFNGLTIETPTGSSCTLERSDRDVMARHYGIDGLTGHRRWRSVTPVAVPRRRYRGPAHRNGTERIEELDEVRRAVGTALRHAGIDSRALSVSPLREPPHARGAAARDFAVPPRFGADRLWHVEIDLVRPCSGPLVIGDGRFLGLGVLAPIAEVEPTSLHVIDGLLDEEAEPEELVRAFRRARLAAIQDTVGRGAPIPQSLSGHERDGRPLRGHRHVHEAWDAPRRRFIVFPPRDASDAAVLDQTLSRLESVRAGRAGLLSLRRVPVDRTNDPLFALAHRWRTVARYVVCRHRRRGGTDEAVAADVRAECRRAGLPRPRRIDVSHVQARHDRGLCGHVTIEFDVAVAGPILLGRTRHKGGGLFQGPSRGD